MNNLLFNSLIVILPGQQTYKKDGVGEATTDSLLCIICINILLKTFIHIDDTQKTFLPSEKCICIQH